MTTKSHDIYRSANGDHWILVRDSENKEGIVRHEPGTVQSLGVRQDKLIWSSR